jgi:hypothetical protein
MGVFDDTPEAEMCERVVLATGVDPWGVTYDKPSPWIAEAARIHGLSGKRWLVDILLNASNTADRFDEVELMGKATVCKGEQLASIGRLARSKRWTTVLPMLFFESEEEEKDNRFDEMALRVREYEPSAEEVNAPNALGATPLHMLCGGFQRLSLQYQLKHASIAHVLLCAGANPLAVDKEGRTPREVMGEWEAPLHEVLESAEEDMRNRQLACAMGHHSRIGSASPLALVSEDIFHSFIAPLLVSPSPRSSRLDYAVQLMNRLEIDCGIHLFYEVTSKMDICNERINDEFNSACYWQTRITPDLLDKFRLLWMGLHAADDDIRRAEERAGNGASPDEIWKALKAIFINEGRVPGGRF